MLGIRDGARQADEASKTAETDADLERRTGQYPISDRSRCGKKNIAGSMLDQSRKRAVGFADIAISALADG